MNKINFEDLAKKLSEAIPSQFKDYQEELQKTFAHILQASLAKLQLVTRDEFEAERAVLQKTRELVESLESRLKKLENTQ